MDRYIYIYIYERFKNIRMDRVLCFPIDTGLCVPGYYVFILIMASLRKCIHSVRNTKAISESHTKANTWMCIIFIRFLV